jgi:rhodanese-related sulfurtransferase
MLVSMLGVAAYTGIAQEGRPTDDAMMDEAPAVQYEKVTCDELKKLIDTKATDGLVIVDLSPKDIYDEGHIPGAISYPWVSQIKPPITLPRNKTLILYCPCVAEEDSIDMANKLRQFGYFKMKLLLGGSLKWDELKYPMVKAK